MELSSQPFTIPLKECDDHDIKTRTGIKRELTKASLTKIDTERTKARIKNINNCSISSQVGIQRELTKANLGGRISEENFLIVGEEKCCTPMCFLRIISPFHTVGALAEVLMYAFFLIIFCYTTFARKRNYANQYVQVLTNRFSETDPSFSDISSEDDLWEWLLGPFIDSMEYDYHGDGITVKTPGFSGSYIVGDVMMRQKRVKDRSCPDSALIENGERRCSGDGKWKDSNESKEPFGENEHFTWSADPQASINEDLLSPQPEGLGGFQIQFSVPFVSNITDIINEIKNKNFVDSQTRLITIERTFYEPNSRYQLGLQQDLRFDFLGGISTTENYRVAKIFQYETSKEKTLLFFEIILALFVCYYIIQECTEMVHER